MLSLFNDCDISIQMQVMSLAGESNTGKESSRKWRATLKEYTNQKFLKPTKQKERSAKE